MYVECIVNVASDFAVPQVETGEGFTIALKADGTVWRSSEIIKKELLEMVQMMIA
jgi:hypothetical protein